MIDLQAAYMSRQPDSHEAGLMAVYMAARAELMPELARLTREKEFMALNMLQASFGQLDQSKETSWIKRIFK